MVTRSAWTALAVRRTVPANKPPDDRFERQSTDRERLLDEWQHRRVDGIPPPIATESGTQSSKPLFSAIAEFRFLHRTYTSEAVNWRVLRGTEDTVPDFPTELLDDKLSCMIAIDGRDEYTEIVEDDIGALYHRCHFYFLRNAEKKLWKALLNRVLQSFDGRAVVQCLMTT